jgi:hypothetical protein
MKPRTFARSGLFIFLLLLPAWSGAQVLLGVTAGGQAEGWDVDYGSVVLINPGTGDTQVLGQPLGGEGLSGIAVAANGTVYVSTGSAGDGYSHLITIDPTTGALIQDIGQMVDGSGNPCSIGDLSIDPTDDTLYGVAANGNLAGGVACGVGGSTGGYLVSIDKVTAEYTLLGRDDSIGNETGGFAFTSDGVSHFTLAWRPDSFVHQLNLTDGSFDSSVALSQDLGWFGLGADLDTGLLYGTATNYPDQCCAPEEATLYTIDPSDGTVTLVGPTPSGVFIHDVVYDADGVFVRTEPAPVPTLSAWGLVLLVLVVGLITVGRMRRTS